MDNRKLVKSWHAHIISECEVRLGRELSDAENSFITTRDGFIALEIIEDTVNSMAGDDLQNYLNSESSDV